MIKRMILMLAAMVVLVGGLFGFKFIRARQAQTAAAALLPPPVTVSADVAREETWRPVLRTTGSLAPVQGVVLSNELAGVVRSIAFASGEVVQKGAALGQLDISTDQAELHGYEAAAELARLNLGRADTLRTSNVSPDTELDAAKSRYDQALASIELVRATIEKKTIRAPFAGRLGLRQINLGQFLPSGSPIVALQSLDPIYVNFALPQQDVRLVETGQNVELSLDAFPGTVFKGAINAFDAGLDPNTRTVRVQATLENKGGELQPGMFGSVAVQLPEQAKVITVPQSAITYNPYGNVVYVIETAKPSGATSAAPLLTVRQQFVQLGETRGDQVAILTGLKAGEQIVTGGQLKLRDGVNVRIDNTVPPANNPAPTPPNA